MKVTIAEFLLATPNGALGLPAKVEGDALDSVHAILHGATPNRDTDTLRLDIIDGSTVVVPYKTLRERLILVKIIEAQVTDGRIALPGQPGFQAPH